MERPEMARRLLAVTFVGALLATFAPACGGMSLEEATALCEEDQERLLACTGEAIKQQCIACHEECGNDCTLSDTTGASTPCQYTCD